VFTGEKASRDGQSLSWSHATHDKQAGRMPKNLPTVALPTAEDVARDEAQAASAGVNLRSLRKAAVLSYDTAVFPFKEAIHASIGLEPPASAADPALEKLNEKGGRDGRMDRGPGSYWIQRFAARSDAAKAAFDAVFLQFVRDVVLPDVGDPKGILFQRAPTFRCHVAGGTEPTGKVHRDIQYGHSSWEINYWLPLTRTKGSNSLYCESSPGLGDYEPFELQYGECQRFWGSQCTHHTLANETEATRVSIDFRVAPRSCHRGDLEEQNVRFRLGGYYAAFDGDGRLEYDSKAVRRQLRAESSAQADEAEDESVEVDFDKL
jgi:hypothetical protein